MQVLHIQKSLFISKRTSFDLFDGVLFQWFRWPSDKSDGLGTTSRISQTTTCSVKGGPITSVTEPTEDTVRDYFQSAMSDCLDNVAENRRSRAMIFLGNEKGS
jgi:hypothetical protein